VSLLLENVRALDLTEAMAGPYCGMLLGDFGADVIKIERPQIGDQSRGWGPPFLGSESTYFLAANRNKRSLTLNLDHPRGVELLGRLLASADVFLVNRPSPASLKKRELDYETLSALNPRLIYCSITGYGFTGPKAGRLGYLDLVKSPHAAVPNPALNWKVKYSQQHEDFHMASQRGMPGPFDNGVMRFAWVAPLITNWMGDSGFLRKLYVQIKTANIYGDVTWYRGKVVDKVVEAGQGVVKLEITGTNQANVNTTGGRAEVILPLRG